MSKTESAQLVDVQDRDALLLLEANREHKRSSGSLDVAQFTELTTGDLERLGEGELISTLVNGRYRVERLLGRGGMASVYAAHDTALSRPVALTGLSEDYCVHAHILARFLRVPRLNATLHLSHILQLLVFGLCRS